MPLYQDDPKTLWNVSNTLVPPKLKAVLKAKDDQTFYKRGVRHKVATHWLFTGYFIR